PGGRQPRGAARGGPPRRGRRPRHRLARPGPGRPARRGPGRAGPGPGVARDRPAQLNGPDPTADPPSGQSVDAEHMGADLEKVLRTEEQILSRLDELAQEIWKDYEGKDLLLVGVLKGAVMVMADLMRALPGSVPMDWMAVSSYGSGTKSSGVVRILMDLREDITDRHVLIVEDIIDSGLTLNWISNNLRSRKPASLEICTLLRKPEAAKVDISCRYVG